MEHDVQQFIERMGRYFEGEGTPRISGRIFALLLLNASAFSLDDLADTLQVSKGSVSTNARLLEMKGLVERVSHPGDRRDYYQIDNSMHRRMLERRLERMREMRVLIGEGLDTSAAAEPAVADRLRTFDSFHEHGIEGITRALEQVKQCFGEGAVADLKNQRRSSKE